MSKKYLIGSRLVSEKEAMSMISVSKEEILEPVIELEDEETNEQLEAMTVKELTEMAEDLDLDVPSKARKGDIIDMIEAAQAESIE